MIRIVVHGGAGTVVGEERRKLAATGVNEAVVGGYGILDNGGSALQAVCEAVKVMEDLPQFNAGYGSVVTEEKTIEMDAMVVDGLTGKIGGVIGVSSVKNPIMLSKIVLENSDHMLFMGKGAEKFARENGMEMINPSTLITDRILERLENSKKSTESDRVDPEGRKFGTVGAVAVDNSGGIAVATSTGGTLGKKIGRVGDTPMFGSGTYANPEFAASATGVGEYIIQGLLASRIYHLTTKHSLHDATKIGLNQVQTRFGPSAVICIDKYGDWSASKTTRDLVYAMMDSTTQTNFLDHEET